MEVTEVKGSRLAMGSDNVVFLVGFGSWGVKECRDFVSRFRALTSGLKDREWAVLGDATDWNFENPKALEIIADQNRWIVSHGCRASCYYAGTGALKRLLLYRLAMPDTQQYQFRVYSKRVKAVRALEERGFHLSDQQIERFFREEGSR